MTTAQDVSLPAVPAGGVVTGEWEDADTGSPWRVVHGTGWPITDQDDLHVFVNAAQKLNGSISEAFIYVAGFELNSKQARELAAALLEGADQLDGWTEPK